MSIDRIAVVYKVDRSTVARWLADTRASLLKATRVELAAALHLTASECDSLFALVRSQLHVSIIRHLT